MAKLSRSDIVEEMRYTFECPGCRDTSEFDTDPQYEESVECEHCGREFELTD